ncbi:hypothetical protein DFQ26_003098, partial [Actinomortierella ambigua]
SWLVSYGRAIREQLTAQRDERITMTVLGKHSQVTEDSETEADPDAAADADTDGPIFSRRSTKRQQRRFAQEYAETGEVEIGC